jgi:hypothetical protein
MASQGRFCKSKDQAKSDITSDIDSTGLHQTRGGRTRVLTLPITACKVISYIIRDW